MPYFIDADQRRKHELVDGVHLRTFWGEFMTAAVVDLEPNAVVPIHDHPNEQVGMVLEGKVTFTIEDETRDVGPGDMYLIPGGVRHGATAGNQPARLIEVFAPARSEYEFPD